MGFPGRFHSGSVGRQLFYYDVRVCYPCFTGILCHTKGSSSDQGLRTIFFQNAILPNLSEYYIPVRLSPSFEVLSGGCSFARFCRFYVMGWNHEGGGKYNSVYGAIPPTQRDN